MVKKITYPKYTSKRTLPKNFKESDKQIFYSEFNKKFPGFEADIHGLVSKRNESGVIEYFVDCVKPH